MLCAGGGVVRVHVLHPERERQPLALAARQDLVLLRARREEDDAAEQGLDVDVRAAADGRGVQPEAAARRPRGASDRAP